MVLYKFREWSDGNHRRMLTNSEIYFSSSLQFNDPFDRGLPPRYDRLSNEQLTPYITRHLDRHEEGLSPSERQRRIREVHVNRPFDDPKYRKYVAEKQYAKHGIFSISRTRDNNLLWSHYAESHKGFCVGFNKPRLQEYLNSQCKTAGPVIELYPVKYQHDYPVLIPDLDGDDEKYMADGISIKSKVWEYEEEVRCISMFKSNWALELDVSLFEQVILGAEMPADNCAQITELVKDKLPKVELIRAILPYDSYELKFERID
jgi:Protein of unknown function (DUF2971)